MIFYCHHSHENKRVYFYLLFLSHNYLISDRKIF